MARLLVTLSLAFVCSAATAAEPPAADELASVMRTLLLTAMPAPLVEQDFDWGRQRMVPVGVRWERQGLLLKPIKLEKMHNDGSWRRIRVEADDADKNLTVAVKNVETGAAGTSTFVMTVILNARIKFEQQLWKGGTRLYSGETRARCRPTLTLKCESTSRVEKTGSFLPDVVYRLRVLEAKLNYDDLVVEHTAGVGGDLAKILGEAVIESVKKWKPSLERNLLEKANRAIVKAGDTKEVRLGLSKFLGSK